MIIHPYKVAAILGDAIKACRRLVRATDKNLKRANDYGELLCENERKLGVMVGATDLHKGGRPTKNLSQKSTGLMTLPGIGISRDRSSRAQLVASLPEDEFQGWVDETRSDEKGQITLSELDRVTRRFHAADILDEIGTRYADHAKGTLARHNKKLHLADIGVAVRERAEAGRDVGGVRIAQGWQTVAIGNR